MAVVVSLAPNQAEQPPASRISVPSCPCQKPRRPSCLNTSRMTGIGRRGGADDDPSARVGAWILHLTSSIGVRTKDVKAPEKAPVTQSSGRDRPFSREDRPVTKRVSRPKLSKRKRLLVSAAAPTRGALIPRYSPRKPSALMDCRKQSRGPVYRRGRLSGWLWSRTLTVSKGYSMYLPTTPAI